VRAKTRKPCKRQVITKRFRKFACITVIGAKISPLHLDFGVYLRLSSNTSADLGTSCHRTGVAARPCFPRIIALHAVYIHCQSFGGANRSSLAIECNWTASIASVSRQAPSPSNIRRRTQTGNAQPLPATSCVKIKIHLFVSQTWNDNHRTSALPFVGLFFVRFAISKPLPKSSLARARTLGYLLGPGWPLKLDSKTP
jgi:hypothetical protein